LLEDEPVELRIKGNDERMPHKAGLEDGAVPNGSNKQNDERFYTTCIYTIQSERL